MPSASVFFGMERKKSTRAVREAVDIWGRVYNPYDLSTFGARPVDTHPASNILPL